MENKWIGQRIDEPDIDLAAMARAQGAVGIGRHTEVSTEVPEGSHDHAKKPALEEAIEHVKKGAVCVVDVRVVPGYDTPMSGAATPARR